MMEPMWRDPVTNLEWSPTLSERMNRNDAVRWCNREGEDWRVPTIKELLTLVDYSHTSPAAVEPLLKDTRPDSYWSSTLCHRYTDDGWFVNFITGYTGSAITGSRFFVRVVRDAKIEEEVEVVPGTTADVA